jgi:hypothetical protein
MKIVEMLFSDITYGTEEYGFIPRRQTKHGGFEEPETEDHRYWLHLKGRGIPVSKVHGGKVYVED